MRVLQPYMGRADRRQWGGLLTQIMQEGCSTRLERPNGCGMVRSTDAGPIRPEYRRLHGSGV